jgi:hypothetical protein
VRFGGIAQQRKKIIRQNFIHFRRETFAAKLFPFPGEMKATNLRLAIKIFFFSQTREAKSKNGVRPRFPGLQAGKINSFKKVPFKRNSSKITFLLKKIYLAEQLEA